MDILRSLRVFVMSVQNGSLSSAGRQLGMSPASVSRCISVMEDKLGARLLNRSSRNLTLTEAGQIYYRYAEQILAQVEEADASVSQLQHAPRGLLRVHSRTLIGTQKIGPALPEFLRRYPEIKIDLMFSNRVIDLIEQNIDVDIRIGALEDSTLIAKKLIGSERVLCASPAYLASAPPILQPADVARHNCLTYSLNQGATVWRFADSAGAVTEVSVNGNFQTDHGPTLRTMALADVGLILMPDWSIRRDLEAGTLVAVLPQYRISYSSFENGIYAVYLQRRHLSAKVRIFVDYLSEIMRDMR